LAANILTALQQVFLPKHNGSGKVKNSDDTLEAIRSSHVFDSHNMNRNLDLHVTEEPTVVECEESAAMFIEEWRETFVLPYEFRAKTIVDGAEIRVASIDKIVECMEGSTKIQILKK
jgi:Zn finger protein HypA/HybF involved in hydrogenase expression